MGYNSTLYAVIEYDVQSHKWVDIIARMDLCVCPMNVKWQQTKGLLYDVNGKPIKRDGYGHKVTSAPIDEVIEAVTAVAEKENYRRARMAKDVLTSIRENFDEYKDGRLMVYHYGS